MNILILALSSGGLLLAFLLLFRIEDARGMRFLSRFRQMLDALVIKGTRIIARVQKNLGAGALRITFHYLVHTVLEGALSVSRYVGTAITKIQQRNRQLVRKAHNLSTTSNGLDAVARHKADTTLSDDERTKLKERSIERV